MQTVETRSRLSMPEAASHETERQGVRVRRASADLLDRWDDLVRSSPDGTPFHRRAALWVMADHSDTTFHPLVGYKGEEPVGIFPVFAHSTFGVNAAFSPPPNLRVMYLGPARCNFAKLKRRRAEKRHHRFVEAALEWINDVIGPRYTHIRTVPSYPDPRPFRWNEFDVTPRYTYRVDLSAGEETVANRFSKDARRRIRRDADALTVRVGDRDHVPDVIDQVQARFEAQGKSFDLSASFATDLYDRLADGRMQPYVCTVDGEFGGGVLTFRDGDAIYGWQGGAKPNESLSINDCLHWHVMREAMDDDRSAYDLGGANEPRLCRYKQKWAPEVVEYYSLERAGLPAKAAAEAYRRFLGA